MLRDPLLAREIDKLKQSFLLLGAEVEEGFRKAIRSVETRDGDLANDIIRLDRKIDMMEIDLEEECLKILALHQPVASDLRFIVTVLKVNNDLERIGDLSVNIAEVALLLSKHDEIPLPFDFPTMSEKTGKMLENSLDALVHRNTDLANKVLVADDEVDAINRAARHQVIDEILQGNKNAETLIDSLRISRALERIADLSTNIAEDVIYLITGEIARHDSRS